MISGICWIPKGANRNVPLVDEPPTQAEINEAMKTVDDALDCNESDYDDEEDNMDVVDGAQGEEEVDDDIVQAKGVASALPKRTLITRLIISLLASKSLTWKIMTTRMEDDEDDEEEDEEIEDKTVKPTDIMIASIHNKDDYSYLQARNLMAVGTMSPEIEIWDLNVMEEFEPRIILGGKLKNKAGKQKKMGTYRKGSHRDSILGIAWNKEYMYVFILAQVQAVTWSHFSPEVILSGSFDKSVALKDVKNSSTDCIRWSVGSDVESMAWDPHNEHTFVVSLENGMVQAFDKRRASSNQNSSLSMFTLHAHEKAVSTISFGPAAPNLLATASTDKMGAIFSVSFSMDSPFLLAVGGSKGNLKVWNTLTETSVANKFGRH
uniref:Uncharacterized protein n=1 Tax=Leersia perrieri TaxID=77586 RepID=A0A0D9WMM2_9ORYZ